MLHLKDQTDSSHSCRHQAPVRTWCTGEFHKQLTASEGYWTLDLCIKEAGKYQSRDDWQKNSPISYGKAIKRGWLTKCMAHIPGFRRNATVPAIWTLERCMDVALKCEKRVEFSRRFHYPYEKSRLSGWLDICCAHMK